MAEIIITKDNVWQYYEKVSDHKAECRFCSNKYVYDVSHFRRHINGKHPYIKEYEETDEGRQEWPWICFKYKDAFTSQCLFCGENLQSNFTSLQSHLHQKHVDEVKNYVLDDWIWKYCTRNDFKERCIECSQKFYISIQKQIKDHIKSNHSEELRNVRERSNIVLSSESVKSLKIKEVHENMWVHYNKLPSLRAKCKWENCVYECNYHFHELLIHMKKKHKAIVEKERAHKNQEPWIYFKYSYEYISDKKILHSECLICGKFLTDSEFLQTHISQEHTVEEKRYFIHGYWTLKYCKQSDVTNEVKCTICCKMITIKINLEVSNHTMECHPEELQSIISKKATDKLRNNDYILKDFKATCRVACGERTCGFESCYIDIANFNKHVKEKHKDIYNYEQAYGHTFPWKHFSYLTSLSLKCHCNNDIDFNRSNNDSDSICKLLTMHLDEHPSEDFFDPSIQKSWEWKYCRQISDFEVNCNSCPESRISLNILLWNFDRHTVTTHANSLTTTQRTHDAAGPSRSQPN